MDASPTPNSVVVIANARSGRGRGGETLRSLERLLREAGISPATLTTTRAGEAVNLARAAAAKAPDLLLVVGGDGTVRDVVAGMSEAEGAGGIPVGIIPGGTGNDLCRTLRIPSRPSEALEIALYGADRELDVWRWDGAPFLNVVGIGLDAAVAGLVNRKFRRLRGTLAYLVALMQTLPRFAPIALEISWPGGEWRGRSWLAACANARCYGGGMLIAADAVPDDGLLDVVVIEDVSKPELLFHLPRLFTGTLARHPRVHSFRVPSAHIGAPPQDVSLDGELIGRTPASVGRADRRLLVRVPR